ncbi:MAG TPA: hypothetical protein VJQ56_07500, partial [Blastocatellia bacterium]|nr:hypothetical protein [Blastocatellia bacterium]
RIGQLGKARPRPARAARRSRVSKRLLQIELKRLAASLGRLPSRADCIAFSVYELNLFEDAFASWNVALKAARTIADEAGLVAPPSPVEPSPAPRWQQLELFERARTAAAIDSTADRHDRDTVEGSPPLDWGDPSFDTTFLIS